MNKKDTLPAVEPVLALVKGELTTRRRWIYRLFLLVSSTILTALIALWVTEPGPLPLRLHIAFGTLTAIGSGWVVVLTLILTRRRCPTAIDRIMTSWMATIACGISLAVSVPIAILRGNFSAGVGLGVLGLVLLVVALMLLRNAYRLKATLLKQLEELKNTSSAVATKLLVFAVVALATSFGLADDHLTRQQISIPTRSGAVKAELGRLKVPLNRTSNDGSQIEIAYLRVRADAPNSSPPTFLLAGGPGESGIEMVRGMFADGGERIRQVLKGDIIGIDQRGVGQSLPNLEVDDKYGFSIEQAGDPVTYRSQIAEICQRVAKQMREDKIDLTAFNTIENADDIEALRKALAYRKINLWGTSYGSHLALAVLKRHDENVDRVMLVSPEGPDHTLKRPLYVTRVLNRLTETNPELLPSMRRVLQRLEKQTVEQTLKHPQTGQVATIEISAFDIELLTWNALGRIETTQRLPALFSSMDRGDFSFPAQWLMRYRESAGIGSAMKHLMNAASGCSEDRHRLISEEMEDCLLGRAINFPDDQLAEAWGVNELGDDFRKPVVSNRPVLILVGDLDPRTPIENARELLKELPNGRLAVIKGGGHGFIPQPRILTTVGSFFNGEDLEKEFKIQMGAARR